MEIYDTDCRKIKKEIGTNRNNYLPLLSGSIVFCILCLFNLLVPVMRSLPDEMGAMALAAKWAGYDWSYVLTHPGKYYGSATAIFMYPFFCIVKNPLILYQCLLGIGAFLHAVTAYIAGKILLKFFEDKFLDSEILLISIICAFFTPSRTSNIDNEPMLVVICWIIVYLIMLLQNTQIKKKKIMYSIILALVLAGAYLSHTRAILYSIVFFILIIIYYFLTRKMLVDIISFSITFCAGMISAIIVVSNIREELFTNHDIVNVVVTNSPQSLVNQIIAGVKLFFSKNGLQGFLDLVFSNVWALFIFTGGMIMLILIYAHKQTVFLGMSRIKKDAKINEKDVYFPFIYCVMGLIFTLFALCLTRINLAILVHAPEPENLSRGHFYLRYYGNYMGPLVLFLIVYLKDDELLKKTIWKILFCISIIVDYCLLNFVSLALNHFSRDLDWFYYFAPFSLQFKKWPSVIQKLEYFVIATVIVAACFLMMIYFAKKNTRMMVVGLLIFLLWEYGYGVVMFDRPFASSENYFLAANSCYDLYEENDLLFKNCEIVYYNNSKYGPNFIVQFMLPQKRIITDLSLMDINADNIILSNKVITNVELSEQYGYVVLDDNEYLYVNSDIRKNELLHMGYTVINVR